MPGSWDAAQGADGTGWEQYGATVIIMLTLILTSLSSSYASETSHLASQAVLDKLYAQAERSQSLLETSMPAYVARSLLCRVPAAELTETSDSVSVAFIALSRFDEMTAQLHPRQLMQVRGMLGYWKADF